MVYNVDIKDDCVQERCCDCGMKKCADNPNGSEKIDLSKFNFPSPEEYLRKYHGAEYEKMKDLPKVHECTRCGKEFKSNSWDDEFCPGCLNNC